MFKTLQNAFKIKDIRQKLIYTFLMLVVVRLGSQLPVPGVNRTFFANWLAAQTGDAFILTNAAKKYTLASIYFVFICFSIHKICRTICCKRSPRRTGS